MRGFSNLVNFIATSYVITSTDAYQDTIPNNSLYRFPKLFAIVDHSKSLNDLSFTTAINYLGNNIACAEPREVCLISFASHAKLLVNCTYNLEQAQELIYSLDPYNQSGSQAKTNIAEALNLAENILAEQDKDNTMILLVSDGKANMPGSIGEAKDKAIAAAATLRKKSLLFYCIGFKDSANDVLRKICDKSKIFQLSNKKPDLCPKIYYPTSSPSKIPTQLPTLHPTHMMYPRLFVVLDYSYSIKFAGFTKVINYLQDSVGCEQAREVCVVGFATKAKIIVACTLDMNKIKEAIALLQPYVSDSKNARTNLAGGLRLVERLLPENSQTDTMVTLFTDAQANIPGNSEQAKQKAIEAGLRVKNKALLFYCFGEGEPDNKLLGKICDEDKVIHIKNTTLFNLCPRI